MRSIVQDRTTVKKQRDYLERKRDELVEKVTLVKSLSGTGNQGCLPLSAVRDADLLLQRDNRFMHSRLTPSIPDSGSKGAMGDGGSTPECGSASTPAVIPPKKQHVVARSSVPPARHQSPSPVKPESSDAYWSSLPEMDDEDPLPKPEENDETIGGTEFSTSLVQLDDDSDVDLSHQRLASLVGAVNQRNGATPLDLPPSDPTGMGRSLSTPSSFY
ncbi:hypothetical protein AGDE_13712 [Angomonas deanei]|nr:hypothetical protein AGDE_13712 [Angomonas deanei]|eukprot:EPY21902.1 hypothetical protein AGDE_13712 [Angomonas deanei]